jgi:dipeptidyl aminopeptidase/acylaminoacyl peptidase
MTPAVTPYGAWPSPISAADAAKATRRLSSFPVMRGEDVWWQEAKPDQGGRTTIVRWRAGDGSRTELLGGEWNARTRVHEYGGRSFLPVPAGDEHGVVFANYQDQRLYLLGPGEREPRPLTPEPAENEPGGLRYADFTLSPDGTEVWCVQERHDRGEVARAIVAVPLDAAAAADPTAVRELVTGADFFASPTPSPDGEHLAWIAWDHPRMPWDGTELRVGTIAGDAAVVKHRTLTGGTATSVLAPTWRDSKSLYVVSDWPGWWNIYQVGISGEPPQALYPAEEEFAGPLWQLGGAPYAVLSDGRLAVLHGQGGVRLGILDPATGELADIDTPYTEWTFELSAAPPVRGSVGDSGSGLLVAGVAGSPTAPWTVIRVDTETRRVDELHRGLAETPDPGYLPTPELAELPGRYGRPVHANIYPPTNPEVIAPEGEPAPFVAFVHGGPTGRSSAVLSLEIAYFTSRGIGVIDVNYGGSAGYGRSYRERLRRQWGVVDVEDVVAAVEALVERGAADGDRLAIRGGSAGGWTTLAAVTQTDLFKAATSYFGVIDLIGFVDETHDFESRYLDGLVGPLPAYQHTYQERSPLSHADQTACPVLLLQGLDDPIVPPAQSERFAEALARTNVPYRYMSFAGEAHGFRRAETVIACLEAELAFYARTLGLGRPDVPEIELTVGSPPGANASDGRPDGAVKR